MTPALHRLLIAAGIGTLVLTPLAGCKTAGELLSIDTAARKSAKDEQTVADGKAQDRKGYRDPRVVVLSDQAVIAGTDKPIAAAPGDDLAGPPNTAPTAMADSTDPNGMAPDGTNVVMQPSAVSAYQSSIFSAKRAAGDEQEAIGRETQASLMPAGIPQHGYNAASASLFSARRPLPAAMPVEQPTTDPAL